MSRSTPIQCPVCGWTGTESDLEQNAGTESCPSCSEAIETG